MSKQTRQTGSFIAVDDAGQEHTIIECRTFIQSRSLTGPSSEKPGLQSFFTENGGHVNKISEHEYEIVSSETRVFKRGADSSL